MIVGRLYFRMLDENEQACKVIDQFVLQPNERGFMIWRGVLVDGFAVASAK